MKFTKSHISKIVFTAVMIALNVVLERFLAFQIESNHITISVITVAFAAVFLGTPYAIAVSAIGDILGAIIAPTGPYFPGFTLTNILTALCIGLLISKNVTIARTTIAIVLNKIFGTLILNSIWVAILYKGGIDAFPAYMVTRIPQAVVMAIVEIVLIILIFHKKSSIRKILSKSIKL